MRVQVYIRQNKENESGCNLHWDREKGGGDLCCLVELAVDGTLVGGERLVLKQDEDEEAFDVGDGYIETLGEEAEVHPGEGRGAARVGRLLYEASCL